MRVHQLQRLVGHQRGKSPAPLPKKEELMARRAWSRVTAGACVLTMCSVASAWAATQPDAPWSLARVWQRTPVGPGPWTYRYADNAGAGVNVFVLDTGIETGHTDFGGRATWLGNVTGDGTDRDCNGWGTHLAATVGGNTYGVAKKTKLIAVKVARCDGTATVEDLVKGIRSALANAQGPRGNVILIGSTLRKSRALDQAVNDAAAKGVVVVVPAGDGHEDACNISPAGAAGAVTVAATTRDDKLWPASNRGRCVDVLGPGEDIVSAWTGGRLATRTQSGTAMAAAHAAGIAATLLSQGTPANHVDARIKSMATKNAVTGLPSDVPNALLYNGAE